MLYYFKISSGKLQSSTVQLLQQLPVPT